MPETVDGLMGNDLVRMVLALGALAAATGAIWRYWAGPLLHALTELVEMTRELRDLLSTEFQTNGGSTLKDALVKSIEWQHQHATDHKRLEIRLREREGEEHGVPI